MQTPGAEPNKIGFAHILRGMAASIVVVGHLGHTFWMLPAVSGMLGAPILEARPYWFTEAVDRFLPAGFLGHFAVALFFLISGFVIPFSLINRTRLQFAVARILRLWPTYAIGLTITTGLVLACATWFGQPRPFAWSTYILHLLFVRDLAWVPSIDGIVWTLEIEVRFYMLMAILAGPVRRGGIWPLIATVVGFTCFTVAATQMPTWLWPADFLYRAHFGLTLSSQMICYMLIGTIFNFAYRGIVSWRVGSPIVALFFVALAVQWPISYIKETMYGGLIGYGAALWCFALAYAMRERLQRMPALLNWLANISYPLYVIHGVAGYAIMRMAVDLGVGIGGCLAIAAVFAFTSAVALHHYVEVPTQALGKRLASNLLRPAKLVRATTSKLALKIGPEL